MKKRFIIFFALVIFAGFIPLHKTKAEELSNKLKGRILLQVESHGEAWYVNPQNSKRYYMANGSEAYNIMRNLGVGITNKDLDKIKKDKNFAKKQQGKIFLQVELHGEAYYIDINGVVHYLKDGEAAYIIMRELGLGIKTSDLIKIISSEGATSSASVVVADTFGIKISTSTCILTNVPTTPGFPQVSYVRAIIEGTAQGSVGARVELPILVWSTDKWDCGDWTLSTGAWIAVGNTCTRKEGQPATTNWTVDTGGEEQGEFLRGDSRYYTAEIYQKGSFYSEKEAKANYICSN